jgi:translation initiation factor IF-3
MASNHPNGNRPKRQKNIKNFIRCNEKIQAAEVRLVGADGAMMGVVPIEDARAEARRMGLDLIEISPNAMPPVCRILDFGKYQYDTLKKQKEHKSNAVKIKEIKFRFCTETHDYTTKLRHIIEFLSEGDKVKVSVFFRGRELGQTQLGFDLLHKLTEDLSGYATLDVEAKLVGRNITAVYSPTKNLKQKQQPKAAPTEDNFKNTVL